MGGLCVIRMALQRANCDFAMIKAEDLVTECVTEQIVLILTLYHSREEGYMHRPKSTTECHLFLPGGQPKQMRAF